ncbi:MAG TPA: hypothetical protein VEL74_25455 [Thermoanaerobaculia bacterium]|nr:hypothetical protein [Thermoanaerobaculia bacterium]
MKKQVKKLTLAKETLGSLNRPDLVAGGTITKDTTCPCFEGSWCACSERNCSGWGC